LVYKVRVADGTFAIVHINRPKKAYRWEKDSTVLPTKKQLNRTIKLDCTRKLSQEENTSLGERQTLGTKSPIRTQVIESRDDSMSETNDVETGELIQEGTDDPDWTPESTYLQRKLQSYKAIDGVAYQLRSRLVCRSEPEPEGDTAQNFVT
jgi:hypothetical protein